MRCVSSSGCQLSQFITTFLSSSEGNIQSSQLLNTHIVKKLKDLEREKDLLWMGLQALEQVREKLCSNLDNDMEVKDKFSQGEMKKVFPDTPTLLLAQIHRVNRTLRNLLCDSRNPTVPATEGTEGHQPSPACSEERTSDLQMIEYNIWTEPGLSDGGKNFARKMRSMVCINIPGDPAPLPLEVGLLLLVNKGPKVPQVIELLDWQDQPDHHGPGTSLTS
ncbi:hypothetical protein G5714_024104 [Onychostoma macrolepis]|uniref:non-specific serine/threonine protein kinase n=1 Tax=Onychostoma macrolepis TaxID=369639 RepID=A0A7J6BJA8_9TELE|nr:hypothetical protein G5714_024104 [Onychostoma macrolepis]